MFRWEISSPYFVNGVGSINEFVYQLNRGMQQPIKPKISKLNCNQCGRYLDLYDAYKLCTNDDQKEWMRGYFYEMEGTDD
jgi:hypothetical protein